MGDLCVSPWKETNDSGASETGSTSQKNQGIGGCKLQKSTSKRPSNETKLSYEEFAAWQQAHSSLLKAERDAEVEENALLLKSCPAQLLEREGLALLNLGVSNLSIGLGERTLIELERPAAHHVTSSFPSHTFRPGDLARLVEPSKGSKGTTGKQDETQIDGVIARVFDAKIVLAVKTQKEIQLPSRLHLYKLANDATFDRMERTMDFMRKKFGAMLLEADGASLLPALPAVLLGLRRPDRAHATPRPFMDEALNDSQKEAARFALDEAQELALIHGPPGTGKTQTLVEIIRQLVDRGQRVLVCGASNLAVDNLVERLTLHQVKLTRIGHPARVLSNLYGATLDFQVSVSDAAAIVKDIKTEIDGLLGQLSKGKISGKERKTKWDEVKELRKEFRKRESKVTSSVLDQARVVLCTCHGAGSRAIQNLEFDVVVIDEAAQALEAVCWVSILKGKKLILAGDHLQLPPTVKSDDEKRTNKPKETKKTKPEAVKAPKQTQNPKGELQSAASKQAGKGAKSDRPALQPPSSLSFTLFDRMHALYGKSVTRTLTTQYRMNEAIMRYPSEALYEGKLVAAESVRNRLLTDFKQLDTSIDDCLSEPLVFYDTAGCDMFERTDADDLRSADSKFNENEAVLVERHLQLLVDAGLDPRAISIISPYQAQVAMLARSLREKFPGIEIGSVDGFQGRENEVVIVSLVRSNEKNEVGFLKDHRRLNVAMTRPRRQLVVVGDSHTVSQGSSFLKKWMEYLEEHADVQPAGMLEL